MMADTTKKSGIQKSSDGAAYIPASKRADGSLRKEIRVRPGYTPPEDVETYKNRNAQAFQTRGNGGVPGAEDRVSAQKENVEPKSKNAKRREAARKKVQEEQLAESGLVAAMEQQSLAENDKLVPNGQQVEVQPSRIIGQEAEAAEKEKRIRNQLKKLKAVRELKDKKSAGEKLAHDQLLKIGKEPELIRDLRKLGYEGPDLEAQGNERMTSVDGEIEGNDDV